MKNCFSDPFLCIFTIVRNRYQKWFELFSTRDFQPHHVFYILFLLTILPVIIFSWEATKAILIVILFTSPIWLTIVFSVKIWNMWLAYIRLLFLANPAQEPQLYELIVPKAVLKSPVAMELFFNGLLISQGETTEFDRYWKGRVRPWWSVEIASVEGEVKMYFWCWKRFTSHVEAQLYAQFPEIKMVPIEDYSRQVEYDPKKHFAWGHRYKLDKDEALPIKTYFDYGLHENADKWETKIDPMVNILEKFALMQEGEQLWMQILFQKSDRKTAEEAEKIITEIYKNKTPEFSDFHDKDKTVHGAPVLTPNEREITEAVQRAGKKPAFDVIIRNLYFADKENMNTLRIQSMGKMFQYYDGFNSLLAFDGKATGGDYPWEKWTLPDNDKVMRNFIEAYRLRSAFYQPFLRPTITLSSEELATIFHFPSQEASVPGMARDMAKSVAPPTNLPI